MCAYKNTWEKKNTWVSLVAQTVKNLPAKQETQVWSLGWEDRLEKGIETHSSILAWRIPWTEDSGGLQSMGSQRVRHDWATNTFTFIKKYVTIAYITSQECFYTFFTWPKFVFLPQAPCYYWQMLTAWCNSDSLCTKLKELFVLSSRSLLVPLCGVGGWGNQSKLNPVSSLDFNVSFIAVLLFQMTQILNL